ncbi:MAG: sporulation transcriptional regulator SpoIIID [Ruminococcus sp.]|nr:sporulation transcriptional regulator SpoIIID [Ruminococcus sp.]MBR2304275.1 sporulation transcriptional regulator SpoIIID [Ruminococcus sp.]
MSAEKPRSVILGEYMLSKQCTVRACAKAFGISKSTVHKDVSERLKTASPSLYSKVRHLLDKNKEERHIRGGRATREKYRSADNRK